jgi:hypothetical protein
MTITCPHCSGSFEQDVCASCGARVTEAESVTANGKRLCLTCAASAVRQKGEAAVPPAPDPETDPQAWEAAWRARRRSLGA